MLTRKFGSIFDDPMNRLHLFVEGEGDGGGEGDPPADPPAGDPPADPPSDPPGDDWRASIEDEKLRDHASKFNSVPDLVSKHFELRQQLSTAIKPLGKEPTEEQVAAYRKSLGVPDSPEGYEFTAPEGHELTDADKAFQSAAAEAFHKFNVPAETAKGLTEWWSELSETIKQAPRIPQPHGCSVTRLTISGTSKQRTDVSFLTIPHSSRCSPSTGGKCRKETLEAP
jgi:hypothetical protein